jgi:hypothetical protein
MSAETSAGPDAAEDLLVWERWTGADRQLSCSRIRESSPATARRELGRPPGSDPLSPLARLLQSARKPPT